MFVCLLIDTRHQCITYVVMYVIIHYYIIAFMLLYTLYSNFEQTLCNKLNKWCTGKLHRDEFFSLGSTLGER